MEPISIENNKVWYVTGCSTGLGLELVKALLNKENTKVVGTTRNIERLEKELTEAQRKNITIVKTDITSESSVKESIEKAIETYGKIDVVVNNAGYGVVGAVEEISDQEYRDAFNVNFFGVLNVMRSVTPYLRKQKSGVVFNIASVAGWIALPELSAYHTTKYALTGLTFSLEAELSQFGIKVILVSPAGFKSSFVDTGLVEPKNRLAEYNTDARKAWLGEIVNSARGDPEKFASILIHLSTVEKPPKNIFLGSHSKLFIDAFLDGTRKELEENLELTCSADFADAPKLF